MTLPPRNAHQLELLVMSLNHRFRYLANSARVELLLGLRLGRTALARHKHVLEGAEGDGALAAETQDACLVERLAGRVVLLPVGVAWLRVGGHDDPGLGAIDARLP